MDKVRDAFYAWKSVDNNHVYVDVDANSLETFKAGAAWQAEQLTPKDKPTECANGCPVNQVCDYCQRGATAALMPCGASVQNVYEAYEAGKKAAHYRHPATIASSPPT